MTFRTRTTLLAALLAPFIAGTACKSVQRGASLSCVPNQQSACSCPGGETSFQVCLPDGYSLSECECPSTGTGATGGESAGGSGAVGGSALGGAAGGGSGTGGSTNLGPAPLGSWPLNEGAGSDVADMSGNANDGTVFGATWTDGVRGRALTFDGSDDYVQVGESSGIEMSASVTATCWVSLSSLDDAVIFGSYRVNSQFDDPYWLHLQDGRYHFSVIGDDTSTVTVGSPESASTDTWQQLAGVFDGTEIRLYVDGELVGSEATPFQELVTSTLGIGFGNEDNGGIIFPLAGAIDEIQLYGDALTSAQILNSFESVAP